MRDAEHPFFRPLWRRVAIVLFCAAWSAFEFWNGSQLWGTFAGGMAVYGLWMFLLSYRPPAESGAEPPAEPDAGPPAEKE